MERREQPEENVVRPHERVPRELVLLDLLPSGVNIEDEFLDEHYQSVADKQDLKNAFMVSKLP